MKKRVNCHRCIYYYVTWEQNSPHGCKAYSFKSKLIPSVSVRNSSGMDCNMFTLKTNQS